MEHKKKEKPLFIHNKRWYRSLKASKTFPNSSYLLKDYDINDLVRCLVVCLIPNKLPGMKFEYRTKKGKMIHLYGCFDSYVEFYQYMCKFDRKNRNFFEVIFGELPQKPHFDIDISKSEAGEDAKEISQTLYQAVIQGCIEVCQDHNVKIDIEKDILLYSSHGETKFSYHLVLNNKCHDGNEEARAFYTAVVSKVSVITQGKYLKFIDNAVYNPKQQFRMMGCQKYGSDRPKVFYETFVYQNVIYHHSYIEDVSDENIHRLAIMYESLVSFVSGCTFLPSLVPPKPIYNNNIPDVCDEIVAKCVRMMKNKIVDCPFTAYQVNGGLILLKRNSSSRCPLCDKIHENQDPYMYIVSSKVYWDCRRTDKGSPKLFLGYLLEDDVYNEPVNVKRNEESEESDGEGIFMFGDYDMGSPTLPIIEKGQEKEKIYDVKVQNRTVKNVVDQVKKISNYANEKQHTKDINFCNFSINPEKLDFSPCRK